MLLLHLQLPLCLTAEMYSTQADYQAKRCRLAVVPPHPLDSSSTVRLWSISGPTDEHSMTDLPAETLDKDSDNRWQVMH